MNPPVEAEFELARRQYHADLRDKVMRLDKGIPSIADKDSRASRDLAFAIFQRIGIQQAGEKLTGQTAGKEFEMATAAFVRRTFLKLRHRRPGVWDVHRIGEKETDPAGGRNQIARFEQYRHLTAIAKAASENPELAASLGSDYLIKPDIVICRDVATDAEINRFGLLVNHRVAMRSSLREISGGAPLLHASISCKLTIRSDRSQNSRSEALNLIRNRRGKLPHVVIVTAEPLPSRLASIALGSGDIDCVYHFALPELEEAAKESGGPAAQDDLRIMIQGRRLKDIADLPLDLAV